MSTLLFCSTDYKSLVQLDSQIVVLCVLKVHPYTCQLRVGPHNNLNNGKQSTPPPPCASTSQVRKVTVRPGPGA